MIMIKYIVRVKWMQCQKCGAYSSTKFCPECGSLMAADHPSSHTRCPKCQIATDGDFCGRCGINIHTGVPNTQRPNPVAAGLPSAGAGPRMVCPRCGGDDISISSFSQEVGAGCFTILLYIVLAVTIVGWIILIPILMRKKKSIIQSACVCRRCGHQWKMR